MKTPVPLVVCACIGLFAQGLSAQQRTDVQPRDRFVTDNSGETTLEIPIPVPQGTGGFEPQLKLSFSSTHADGAFGVGWKLNLGAIERSTRFGVPSYAAGDSFELDGEILVEDSSTPGEYRLLTESFVRIRHDLATDSWTVEAPNGRVNRFGTSPSSKIRLDGTTDPTVGGPVAVYLVGGFEDEHGNVINVEYERSIDVGTAYPKSISYTHRGGVLVGNVERRVEFLLEPRPDELYGFQAGTARQVTRRVREIRTTVDGAPFRRLILTYSQPGEYTTDRSRLVGAQLFGSDCPIEADPETECVGLPKETFAYSDSAALVAEGQATNWTEYQDLISPDIVTSSGEEGIGVGDLNGDGDPDLVQSLWRKNVVSRAIYAPLGNRSA